jgi:hypothetical protein
MNYSLLNYIGRIYIELNREIDFKIEHIDIGGILLECNGRTFRLDVDRYITCGTEIECRMVYDINELKGTFDDSKFDLTKEDLLDDNLKAEICITSENYQNKELVQITSIKLAINNLDHPKNINLCLEGLVEKYRLLQHLKDYCFEINEEDNVAEVYTDQDSEEDAMVFETQYKTMGLVHCDMASDVLDITAHVYMELSELLKLDEVDALNIIKKAA